MILKEENSSPLRAFNALVIKIEKLTAIAEKEHQTEKAKNVHLLAEIEQQPWFMTATSEVEKLQFFSEVVQKINYGLSKIALNDPRFDKSREHNSDRDRLKMGIL